MLHGGGPDMIVGCPREIKNNENRVGITPAGAWALTKAGHQVLVERAAGVGSAFSDEDYAAKCAELVDDAAEVWARSDMVVKVKEPLASEYQYFRDDLVLFTYLHLAPDRDLTDVLLESGIMGIAYETVQLADMSLPLLVPMSEVAGRMSVLVGAHYLAYPNGGLGLLPSGVPGVYPGEILIIGGGIVGINAAKMAAGLGARAIILDVSAERMKYLDDVLPANCKTVHSDRSSLEHYLTLADLVIGAVLVAGTVAPKLVTREMLQLMKPPLGGGRRGRGPGRLFRDHPSHHPPGSRVLRRRHPALCRRQHARRLPAHLYVGAHQRDATLRARSGEQGCRSGREGGSGSGAGRQRLGRTPHLRGGRSLPEPGL